MKNGQPPSAARLVACLALFVTTGCSKTTPPGPLGTFRVAPPFRMNQPESPPLADQQTFGATVSVCDNGRAKIVWHAFKHGTAAYITNYSVELLESSPGYEVTAIEAAGPDRATGIEAFVRQVDLGVRCNRESPWGTRTKTAYLDIDALGHVHENSARR